MGFLGSRPVTTAFFMLSACGLWYVLDGFAYRMLFTALPSLFGLQVLLSDILEALLVSKVGYRTKWFALLIAPGTILHELAHLFAALATGCTVTKAALFSPNPRTGVLGYVAYTQPKDKYIVLREFIVGFAPFFGCGILLLVSNTLLSGGLASFVDGEPIADFGGLLDFVLGVWSSVISFLSSADYGRTAVLALIYLQACFAVGAAPSPADLKGAFSSLYRHIISALFFIAILAFIVLASDNRLGLGGIEATLALWIGSALKFTVVVLASSTGLTALLIPAAYMGSKVSEIPGIAKTIPVTSSLLLGYYLWKEGYGAKIALALAALVFVATLLTFTPGRAQLEKKPLKKKPSSAGG